MSLLHRPHRRRSLRWAAPLVALTLGAAALPGPAATAESTAAPTVARVQSPYATIAKLPSPKGTIKTQGFAAAEDYLYSAKITSDPASTRASIIRTDRAGATTVLRNAATGKRFIGKSVLGHANDMTVVDAFGARHLYVVTMRASGPQLVDLVVSGTSYAVAGTYAVVEKVKRKKGKKPRWKEVIRDVSGISVVTASGSDVRFLFKKGRKVYTGTLVPGVPKVTIAKAFTLTVPAALTTFNNQGFHYNPASHVLYYPLTKGTTSVVLSYPNITEATRGEPARSPDKYRVKAKSFFEIEGVGISGGALYFNTERGDADGVHHF